MAQAGRSGCFLTTICPATCRTGHRRGRGRRRRHPFRKLRAQWNGYWNDQLVIHAGGGNDTISFLGNWFSWNPPAPLIIDAGAGDDLITAWWPGNTAPALLTGGSGADEFRVGEFGELGMLTIADYTVGEDRLSLMNNGEQWIEITPEAIAAPRGVYGYYEAIDSADGLRIVGYHALTRQNPDGTVSYT